jgi:hypothetical protein
VSASSGAVNEVAFKVYKLRGKVVSTDAAKAKSR